MGGWIFRVMYVFFDVFEKVKKCIFGLNFLNIGPMDLKICAKKTCNRCGLPPKISSKSSHFSKIYDTSKLGYICLEKEYWGVREQILPQNSSINIFQYVFLHVVKHKTNWFWAFYMNGSNTRSGRWNFFKFLLHMNFFMISWNYAYFPSYFGNTKICFWAWVSKLIHIFISLHVISQK